MSDSKNERGMVSILVTMIMMIVITLIIIGISQVTRSNRREQLDQQLSAQAYYAAESGLNQATRFFAAHPTAGINTNGNCGKFITDPSSPAATATGLGKVLGVGNMLNSGTNVSYTCLMVNSTPSNLQRAPLTQESNTIWRVRDAAGQPFTQFEFQWTPDSGTQYTDTFGTGNNTCSATNFPAWANWKCAYGILRVDLISTSGTVPMSTLESPAKTLYLVPTNNGSGVTTAAITGTGAGQVVYVKCNATVCDIKLTPAVSSNEYYARLTTIYQDAASVQLSGSDASGAAKFSGGQAVVDVTGRAQDQVRRIQARVPLIVSGSSIPNFALQSTDNICKLMNVPSSGAAITNNCSP